MIYRKVGGIYFLSSAFFTLSFSLRSNRPCLKQWLKASLASRLPSVQITEDSYLKGITIAIAVLAVLASTYMTTETSSLIQGVLSAPLQNIW